MKAKDLLNYFLDKATWVNRDNTVDEIIIGDPEKNIKKLLVVWQPSITSIKHAIKFEYDAIMTHEPTFYCHGNELRHIDSLCDNSATKKMAMEKKRLIEDSGLVIIRNHDIWDRFPDYGIPSAWAKHLGLSDYPKTTANDGMQCMFEVPPVSVYEFAKKLANNGNINPREIQIFGEKDRLMSKVGIGTGCICEIDYYAKMNCDLFIMCDDGASFWSEISLANDMDIPVIRVFHATSEEMGMDFMAKYMNEHFSHIQTDYFPFDTQVSFLL
ncbi:MAG: Nif3-like dinuclear metal center hexameric protein [Defluviitaleaceae bacterium]|nr:Nif3-like dinuclear metal center hexameric protein [Defluviitaleaceae bacterium]